MTTYQKSELLVAARGLLIIVGTILSGIIICSIRDYRDRQKLKSRYPDDHNAYVDKSFGEILRNNVAAVVACIGFSLATGIAFGAFGLFMIFVGFPLIFLALGLLTFLFPYP
jgi:hypothetical protein